MKHLLPVFLLFASAAYAQTADDLFSAGQYTQAIAAYERLPDPEKSAAKLNRLAMSYHVLGKFKEAELAYQKGLKVDSDLPVLRNNFGALFYSQKRFSDADREFRRAAEQNPDSAILSDNLHAARYARDNQRDARTVAEQLAAARPLLLEPLSAQGGDFLAVVSVVSSVVQADASQHETRADVYMARKMYEDAVIEYKRSLAADRYNASVTNRLGIAYHNLRKFRDAEQQYREALRLRPNYLDAINNLAVIDYIREDYVGALERYRKALKLQPSSATILRNMGACLFSLQRWEEGMRAYQLALSFNPTVFDPQPNGVGTSIQMNQQNNGMLNFYLAKIFALRGENDRAFSYLLRAVESGFDDEQMLRDEQAFKTLVADERFGRVLQTIAPRSGRK